MEASVSTLSPTATVGTVCSHNPITDTASGDSFFTDARWLALIESVYGYRVTRLSARGADGEAGGELLVCALSSPLTGRRVVSLPFSDACPLTATDSTVTRQLLDQALALGHDYRARYVELRTGVCEALAGRDDFAASDGYVRWRMGLTGGEDAVWSQVRKPVQRQVRKARKSGVTVRFASSRDEMSIYHRLHVGTRSRKHGMPAQPLRFFQELWDRFGNDGKVQLLLAEYEGAPIAGMVLLAAGDTVRYAYGASDDRYLHLGPNNLLMWESITWAIGNGYHAFDMGRTARDNEGLMNFKRGWGAVETPLTYYYAPQVAGLASTSETSRTYQLLTACWRRLPLPVAATLGSALYKHLG
ncbi:MAG: GNAT family N-acetyltransferase [Ktedonobacterales bacterium]